MKQIFLTGFLLLGILSAQAQQTILSQDFEDAQSINDQEWGGIDVDGDEASFSLYQSQPVLEQLGFSGNVMGSQSFIYDDENNPVPYDSDNMLLTPLLTLPEEDNLFISFKLCGVGTTAEALSAYKVYIINALNLSGAQTIEELIEAINAETPVAENTVNQQSSSVLSYNLDDYAGEVVYVIIRHADSTGSTYLFVDDVAVTSGTLSTQHPSLDKSFTLYPNPATDVLYLQNSIDASVQEVSITDVNGRVIKTSNFNGIADVSIPMDDVAAGSYFVKVITDKGTLIKQIIKK